jgi:hypothetical protein
MLGNLTTIAAVTTYQTFYVYDSKIHGPTEKRRGWNPYPSRHQDQ